MASVKSIECRFQLRGIEAMILLLTHNDEGDVPAANLEKLFLHLSRLAHIEIQKRNLVFFQPFFGMLAMRAVWRCIDNDFC